MARTDRLSRYRYLRSLNFSPTEARRYRDYSNTKIEQQITSRQRTISHKPIKARSPAQSAQLTKIRESKKARIIEPTRPTETRQDRLDNFNRWSGTRRFPSDARRIIQSINLRFGKNPYNRFGYRVFYHRYVNGVSEFEAVRLTETRDT